MRRRYAATVAAVATLAWMGAGTPLDAQIPPQGLSESSPDASVYVGWSMSMG